MKQHLFARSLSSALSMALMAVIFVFSGSDVFAQKDKSDSRVIMQASKIDSPVTTTLGTYEPVRVDDVAGLFWKYGVHTYDDVTALNQFLLLKNCVIYDDYFSNDFLWQRIVQSQVREIDYFKDTYKSRFVIPDVVSLARFDFQESVFYLTNDSAFRNMGFITFFNPDTVDMNCDIYRHIHELKKYPINNIYAKLENPVTMQYVPIKREDAQRLIDDLSTKSEKDRVMYSRVYINIIGVSKVSLKGSFSDQVEFLARMERIEIYEDIENKKLLYQRDF